MSWPLNRICPESGRSSALTTLMSEVLPAPFGPTRDTNSRSSMLKLTLSTARVSPKYRLRLMVCRRAMSSPPELAGNAGERADDAGRQHHDQEEKHEAQQQLPVFRAGDGVGLQIVEHHRTDDRTGEGAKAAEHGHEYDLARERPVENVGRGQAIERDPQDAGQSGECARDHEGDPAIAPHAHPDELCPRLVVADRLQ